MGGLGFIEGGLVGRGGMSWKLGEIMGLDQDQVCQTAHETLESVLIFPDLSYKTHPLKKILVQDSDGGACNSSETSDGELGISN
jgi:hypothetical protein